jgi:hypothetical protein
MLLEIHALVQNPDDLNPVVDHPKKEHVCSNQISAVAAANVIAGPSPAGIARDRLDPMVKFTEVAIRLIGAPTIDRIAPNFPQVRSRAR